MAKLQLQNLWHTEGRRFARWAPSGRKQLPAAKHSLRGVLRPFINRSCMHVKGHGGGKRAVRIVDKQARRFTWVAKFDIAAYYDSIDHRKLLSLLAGASADAGLLELVSDYLSLPDTGGTGKGMVAGGSISPLLGALYLHPLDEAMLEWERKGRILYRRFMDDFVILASSRHAFAKSYSESTRGAVQLDACPASGEALHRSNSEKL